jgi:hypothetical protein
LATLEGTVPQATAWPSACRFEPRCPYRWQTCATVAPSYLNTAPDRFARCHLYDPSVPDRPTNAARRVASARVSQPEVAP